MARVLVADDDEQVLEIFCRALTAYGFEVDAALNGIDALHLASRYTPDLIISDVLMPEMDGFALCHACQRDERLRDVPFVFCTASFTDVKDEELAVRLGADRFLIKPVTPKALVKAVQDVLAERAAGPPESARRGELGPEQETAYLKEYNEALVRKLEAKMLELEEANRALEHDIAEREKAEAAVHRQVEELRVLHTVATLGATSLRIDTMMSRVMAILGETIGARRATAWMMDRAARQLVAVAQRLVGGEPEGGGLPGDEAAPFEAPPLYPEGALPEAIALGQGLVGRTAMGGEASLVRDADGGGFILCVPLRSGQRVLGVIEAASPIDGAFGPADQRLVTICADQLATAVERVELMHLLEQRVADRSQELSALYDVTALANQHLDLRAMLDKVLDRVMAALESEAGTIHLREEHDDTLTLYASQGFDETMREVLRHMPVGESLPGWVLRHGQPLAVSDIGRDARAFAPHREMAEGRAYLGAPIQVRGEALGVISMHGEAGNPANLEKIALLSAIADHVGVAAENALLRQQVERAAVQGERQRLSRELHDSAAQSLYAVTLLAEGGRRLAHMGQLAGDDLEAYFGELRETAHQALKEMRLLVYELRSPVMDRGGLVGALRYRLEAVERRAHIDSRLEVEGRLELSPALEGELYRIAQEALNNALKHASAATVTVRLSAEPDHVTLEIVDDGVGLDVDAARRSGGLGLHSIRERVAMRGGNAEIRSAPGEGTTVSVRLPLADAASDPGMGMNPEEQG